MILRIMRAAMDVEHPSKETLVELVTQYGARSDVTHEEVEEVLDMKVRDILL